MENPRINFDFCPNCNFPFPETANYCPNCAQKRTDGRLTVREMLEEFSDAVFNIDSKIFRTLFALFIPGKLTNEYFSGRHKRYVHPLRVFLVMTIGLIAAASYKIDNPDFIGIGDEMNRRKEVHNKRVYMAEADSVIRETKLKFEHPEVKSAMDSLSEKLFHGEKIIRNDSLNLSKNFNISGEDNFMVDWEDYENLTPEEILVKYKVEGHWLKKLLVKQQIRLSQRGENSGFYLIGNSLWMFFLMMPFLALFLKLLYLKKGYYYVEHLIFSFHTHCFAFLLYIIMILYGENAPGWIIGGGFSILAFYVYFALKKVYQQNHFITLIKYGIIFFLYGLVLSFAVFLTALASFALY